MAYDLFAHKSRTILSLVNISIGVFCVGTIFGMIDLLLSKMDNAHQLSQPSHINMILRQDVDLSILTDIKKINGVAEVDSMTQLTVQYKRAEENNWHLATLIIRPDYTAQKFDKTSLTVGHWPTNQKLAIENLSQVFSGIQQGEQLEFQTKNGAEMLSIDGIVRHPFIKPPKFGGQVHFFANQEDAAKFGVINNSFRQLMVQISSPYTEDQVLSVAKQIRTLLAERHILVNVTFLQDPIQHWGRPFLLGINAVLQIMAFVSLVLACVLVFNTVSEHLIQQTHQIGILKALGAQTNTIAYLYLIEILLIALGAILLAIPAGITTSYFSACQLLSLFNIDCGEFEISGQAVWVMVLSGLLVPILAALVPILSAAGMNVRSAIASYGLGLNYTASRFDIWLERNASRFLPSLYAAALGNLFKRKARLILTQSVLIIAGSVFLILMSLIASLNLTLDNENARSQFNVKVGFTTDQSIQKLSQLAKTIPATEKIEFWQRLPLEMQKNAKTIRQKGSLGAQLLALSAKSSLYQPYIDSGRWLQESDAGQNVLLVSADTAAQNNLNVGDQLEISIGTQQQNWQIIGIYRWLVGNQFAVEPVYIPLETLQNIQHNSDYASFALFKANVDNTEQELAYFESLKQVFQNNGIQLDIYVTQAKNQQRQFFLNQFKSVLNTLFGLASMIAAVGCIGLGGALASSVLQRTREIGILRAIGAPSKIVFSLFCLEGFFHALLAWLISLPIAYLIAEPMAHALGKIILGMQLDFAFAGRAVFYWLLIVLLMAAIAAYSPAKKAVQLSVRQALQQ